MIEKNYEHKRYNKYRSGCNILYAAILLLLNSPGSETFANFHFMNTTFQRTDSQIKSVACLFQTLQYLLDSQTFIFFNNIQYNTNQFDLSFDPLIPWYFKIWCNHHYAFFVTLNCFFQTSEVLLHSRNIQSFLNSLKSYCSYFSSQTANSRFKPIHDKDYATKFEMPNEKLTQNILFITNFFFQIISNCYSNTIWKYRILFWITWLVSLEKLR